MSSSATIHRPDKEGRDAFSLVEMLAVISIAMIVLSFLVPAGNSVLSASRLTSAGDLVASLVASARQTAMSGNTMSALVLLVKEGSSGDGTMNGRALTVVRYDSVKGWEQKEPWHVLPEGVVVDLSNTTDCNFLLNSPDPFPFLKPAQANPPVTFKNTQVPDDGYAARIFLPGGGIASSDHPATIRLVEGVNRGGAITYTKEPGRNFYDITVIGETGQIKIDRP